MGRPTREAAPFLRRRADDTAILLACRRRVYFTRVHVLSEGRRVPQSRGGPFPSSDVLRLPFPDVRRCRLVTAERPRQIG